MEKHGSAKRIGFSFGLADSTRPGRSRNYCRVERVERVGRVERVERVEREECFLGSLHSPIGLA